MQTISQNLTFIHVNHKYDTRWDLDFQTNS